MPYLLPAKPFKSYDQLLELLKARGMVIEDDARAKRKLAQVGYYRLSGFWFPCRAIVRDSSGATIPKSIKSPWILRRGESFEDGTTFNAVFDLYKFDKRLRLLMLDALERIEIHIRSIIAHELGRRSPIAYKDEALIADKFRFRYDGMTKSKWTEWTERHDKKLATSKDDCILWHREQAKEIPIWVAIETWDFGLMTKYYNMLKWQHKDTIAKRIDPALTNQFGNWLNSLNILRNKCAHHARIWNMRLPNSLPFPSLPCFSLVPASSETPYKIHGLITIIWFLMQKIGPNSDWRSRVRAELTTFPKVPNCTLRAMGFPTGESPLL